MNTITKEFTKEELIALALAEIAARRFMIESGTYGADVVEFYRRKLVLSKISLASLEAGPVVTFYRDGIEAAATWVDKQRDAYDSEHGRHDPDTGDFEFGNDAQRDYSATLEEIAEGIRALHPNAGNSPVIPDGYVLVPIVPTEDMIINGFESEPDPHFSDEKEWEEYKSLSGCRQAARRAELCWAAMIKTAPKKETL
ncbi:hypothetical protein [Citrobacter amalonaticus]|uniref:hypothetical protein n=1 Tax=Citrobacter amalonaticus TaxID=35703 RepID=UPI001CE492FE|nr:hypothetical protein [Citrobacter amalonaticus]